jgi:hypothetical protein
MLLSNENYIFKFLTSSIGKNMGQIGEGGGVWSGPPVGFLVLGGVSSFVLDNLHGILNISSESLAQAQSIATLLEQIG